MVVSRRDHWQVAPNPPFGSIESIFADDTGFVAAGHWSPGGSGCAFDSANAQGLTFTSTDGQLWRWMPTDGWDGKLIEQLRRDGRTLIGIGVEYTQNSDGVGAVWTSDLPDSASDTGPVPPITPPSAGRLREHS